MTESKASALDNIQDAITNLRAAYRKICEWRDDDVLDDVIDDVTIAGTQQMDALDALLAIRRNMLAQGGIE